MSVCNRCGAQMGVGSSFCPYCGAVKPMAPPAPLTPQSKKTPGKGQGIAGMILSIVAMVYGCIWFLLGMTFAAEGGWAAEESLIIVMVFAMFTLPLPILAVSFSSSARKQGFIHGMSSTGLTLGLISLIMHGITILTAIGVAG